MNAVLVRKENRHRDRYTQEEKSHVTMEAEIGVMHVPAREHQGLPANI